MLTENLEKYRNEEKLPIRAKVNKVLSSFDVCVMNAPIMQ